MMKRKIALMFLALPQGMSVLAKSASAAEFNAAQSRNSFFGRRRRIVIEPIRTVITPKGNCKATTLDTLSAHSLRDKLDRLSIITADFVTTIHLLRPSTSYTALSHSLAVDMPRLGERLLIQLSILPNT